MINTISKCRLCSYDGMDLVINLGNQLLTSRFPKLDDLSTPSSTMVLVKCRKCHLVQLRDSISSDQMYEHQYGYRSGISNTMRTHLQKYNEQIQSKIQINEADFVLDIGCNDGKFLLELERRGFTKAPWLD